MRFIPYPHCGTRFTASVPVEARPHPRSTWAGRRDVPLPDLRGLAGIGLGLLLGAGLVLALAGVFGSQPAVARASSPTVAPAPPLAPTLPTSTCAPAPLQVPAPVACQPAEEKPFQERILGEWSSTLPNGTVATLTFAREGCLSGTALVPRNDPSCPEQRDSLRVQGTYHFCASDVVDLQLHDMPVLGAQRVAVSCKISCLEHGRLVLTNTVTGARTEWHRSEPQRRQAPWSSHAHDGRR